MKKTPSFVQLDPQSCSLEDAAGRDADHDTPGNMTATGDVHSQAPRAGGGEQVCALRKTSALSPVTLSPETLPPAGPSAAEQPEYEPFVCPRKGK